MTVFTEQDSKWMREAIKLAEEARDREEVPVGAILVKGNQLIGKGCNSPIASCDPTAHAEIVALRHAGTILQNYRLVESTLYVTLEPCVMCLGALVHARVKRVVFGAYDAKAGAVESALTLGNANVFNHQIEWQGGLFSEECGLLLSHFFQKRRRPELARHS